MPRRRTHRTLTAEEQTTLEKLSRSSKVEHRLVERAQIILWAREGMSGPQIAKRVEREVDTIYRILDRFEAEGLSGLTDRARSGRPPEYSEEERGKMIAAARTKPSDVGREFGYWSLSRLVEYVTVELGIPISRAQLARVLHAEGLRWYQEKVFFTERPDPQFAEKRGR
jgi:transposase